MLKFLVDRIYRPGSDEDFIYADDANVGYTSNFHVNRDCIPAAEELLVECNGLYAELQLAQQELSFVFFKKLRQQRRDNKLFSHYEAVVPKIKVFEKLLRSLIGTIVDKKNLLRSQSNYLQIRISSCRDYNNKKLDEANKPVVEARRLLNVLLDELSVYKSMSAFNDEIVLMKLNHERVNEFSPPGAPMSQLARLAAMKTNMRSFQGARERPLPLMETDEERIILQDKIDRLNELKLKSMNCLSAILQQREVNLSTQENCDYFLTKLSQIAKKDSSNDLGPDVESYDHEFCLNCDYSCKLAHISIAQLAELSEIGATASSLLQRLVEIREGIMDLAVKVDFTSNSSAGPQGGSNDFEFQAGLVTSKFSGGSTTSVTRTSIGSVSTVSTSGFADAAIPSSTQGSSSPRGDLSTKQLSGETSQSKPGTINQTLLSISTLMDREGSIRSSTGSGRPSGGDI
jgi:hypothetical protein